jgi:DNA-binding MarR family transcriptional regulator
VITRVIRRKFREQRAADLTVAQFRTLAFLDRQKGASLSDVAGHIGLALPSMSKMVDGLVSRKLLNRVAHNTDRRRVCLSVTPAGKKKLQASYADTQAFLAEKIAPLSTAELETVSTALHLLEGIFTSERETEIGMVGERK